MHDPLATAVIFGYDSGIYEDDNVRYAVTVVTDGAHGTDDALRGQVGRTIATKLASGTQGVKIPRKLNVDAFWKMLEECCSIAEMNGALE